MSKTGSSSSFPGRDDDSIMSVQRTTTSRSGSSSVSSKSKTTTTAKPSKSRGEGGGKTSEFLGGFLRKVADWASTSEPSMQALSQYKQDAFRRAGVSPNDSEAHTKLHAPIGEIPEDAIRPTTGPTPEEVLIRKKTERKRRQIEEELRRDDIGGGGRGGSSSVRLGSVSSSTVGSGSSRKGSVLGGSSAVPWDTSGW